jgi:hypothetical protein
MGFKEYGKQLYEDKKDGGKEEGGLEEGRWWW